MGKANIKSDRFRNREDQQDCVSSNRLTHSQSEGGQSSKVYRLIKSAIILAITYFKASFIKGHRETRTVRLRISAENGFAGTTQNLRLPDSHPISNLSSTLYPSQ
jgi:hypothetical protein